MNEQTQTSTDDAAAAVSAHALAEQAAAEASVVASEAAARMNPSTIKSNAVKMPSLGGSGTADLTAGENNDRNLNVILDIPVILSMEVGRTRLPIRKVLQLSQGSVVELDRLAGEPMDVLVNGTLIAHGEVVVINERYGIRLTDVVSPAERVRKLR
jgi:flagellar motor switch protein FliN/FliY